MQLTPFCLMLSCLRVSPDRSQFFRYDTISLTCEDPLNSTGWTVKRKTKGSGIRRCSSGWGSMSSGSACTIGSTYPTDSGVYWCESADGEQSNGVNITITDRTVILESPALPVSVGATVTLRCQAEVPAIHHVFTFYKDGHHIHNSSTGELTIPSVSKSDEGLYMCSISGVESASSWLTVNGATHDSSGATDMKLLTRDATAFTPGFKGSFATSNVTPCAPVSSCPVSVFRLMWHLLVAIPYVVSTILLGLICRDRRGAAGTVAERRGSKDVVMEIIV